MPKGWLLPVLGLAGMVWAGVYVRSSGALPAPTPAPQSPPPSAHYDNMIGGAGLIEPDDSRHDIAPQVGGTVTEVVVRAGDRVARGDVLFKLDDRSAQAARAEAAAAVRAARIEAERAAEQYKLVQGVDDHRALSRDEVIARKYASASAAAALELAEARLQSAETALSLLSIRAPIAGTVMSVDVHTGEYVSPAAAQPPAMRLGNLDQLQVRIDIDENDARRLKPGASAQAFLRGEGGNPLPLQFVRIEPYVRPKQSLTGASLERVDTRVLQVIYRLQHADARVYAGQQVDAAISAD